MIARLSGTLAETGADTAIVDVGGVGYQVHASGRTLDSLGPVGGEIVLLTELQVREDGWTLFGFGSLAERDAFRALTGIQGVGGRLALAILSTLSPDELARAVAQDDKAMIGRASGVGPKLAARIVAELKDKAPAFSAVDPALVRLSGAIEANTAPQPVSDAVSALVNLGYAQAQASAAVAAALRQAGEEAEAKTLIRLGLRELAR